ncbi:MAG: hypothetical protein ISQ06_08205 [Planctomycetaceae bacterium]|jgi:hypothetical protein|nr:hypothetical protein [Planctomycetaceae bacterium]
MRAIWKTVSVLSIFGLGYLAGTMQWSAQSTAVAQPAAEGASQEVTKSITAAYAALQNVRSNLNQEARYTTATKIINATGLMAGGLDAMSDLESGQGVDPETFGGLYAGYASDEVSVDLDTDENGRLTYKGKVVRMYSIERLKKFYKDRLKFAGNDEETAGF